MKETGLPHTRILPDYVNILVKDITSPVLVYVIKFLERTCAQPTQGLD